MPGSLCRRRRGAAPAAISKRARPRPPANRALERVPRGRARRPAAAFLGKRFLAAAPKICAQGEIGSVESYRPSNIQFEYKQGLLAENAPRTVRAPESPRSTNVTAVHELGPGARGAAAGAGAWAGVSRTRGAAFGRRGSLHVTFSSVTLPLARELEWK